MNMRTFFLPTAAFVAALSLFNVNATAASVAQDVRSVITIEDDEQTIVIRRENGEMTVEVNGERVPAGRVQRDGDRLRVVDENGAVIADVQIDGLRMPPGVMADGARGERRLREARVRRERALAEEGRAGLRAARPRAQMGVMLGRVDDTLAQQLNLNADEVVLITEILPGLAADKAGIRKHDIIVRVNGDAPATPAKLREVVLSRQPNESIRLEVLREGETEEIDVTLEPFQTDALLELEKERAGERLLQEDVSHQLRDMIREFYQNRGHHEGDGPRMIDQLRMEIEEARPRLMRQWRHLQSDLRNVIENVRESLDQELSKLQELAEDEELNRKLQQAIDQALQSVSEAMESAEIEIEEIAPRIEFFRRDGDELGILIHPHQLPAPPAPPAPPATERHDRDRRAPGQMERGLRAGPDGPQLDRDQMDDRFNRLEERLERLEQMIRRLAEERASN